MRLMAKEDDVYKLMDRRDLYLGAAGLCGIVSVVLLLFISYGYGNWENLYFLSVLIVGMIFLLYYTWKINQRIMEADGINELDLMTLTEMGKDGYLFEIENGRIQNILMVTGILK